MASRRVLQRARILPCVSANGDNMSVEHRLFPLCEGSLTHTNVEAVVLSKNLLLDVTTGCCLPNGLRLSVYLAKIIQPRLCTDENSVAGVHSVTVRFYEHWPVDLW